MKFCCLAKYVLYRRSLLCMEWEAELSYDLLTHSYAFVLCLWLIGLNLVTCSSIIVWDVTMQQGKFCNKSKRLCMRIRVETYVEIRLQKFNSFVNEAGCLKYVQSLICKGLYTNGDVGLTACWRCLCSKFYFVRFLDWRVELSFLEFR